jgi:hypothetical protein
MMPAVRRIASLAVLAAAAVPAQALAARPFAVYIVPVRAHGYDMTIVGLPRESDSAPLVRVELDRDIGRRDRHALGGKQYHQDHSFLVDRGAQVRIAADLRSALITADLGSYGRIDLTVKAPPPDDSDACPPTSGNGNARGTFRLRPGGGYFGVIARRRMPALIVGGAACAARIGRALIPARQQIALGERTVTAGRLGRSVVLRASNQKVFVGMIRAGTRVFVEDTIIVDDPPRSTLTISPEFSSASLRTVGPFLSGTGSYTATSGVRHGHTTGLLSGNLTAWFDSPGPLPLTRRPVTAVLGNFGYVW